MTCTSAFQILIDNTGWFIALAVMAPFIAGLIVAAGYELRYRFLLRQERAFNSGLYRGMAK